MRTSKLQAEQRAKTHGHSSWHHASDSDYVSLQVVDTLIQLWHVASDCGTCAKGLFVVTIWGGLGGVNGVVSGWW